MISETMDDCLRICPYCENSYQVESEDYSEDAREEECDHCGKKYYACDSFLVTHYAVPDCELNGEKHRWAYDGNFNLQMCTRCGKAE